jgi:hypothetical protein
MSESCVIDGCTSPQDARKLCKSHQGKMRRAGRLDEFPLAPPPTPLERLERSGWTVTDSGCWEWSGSRDKRNYGTVSVVNRNVFAHRHSYEVFIGPIPDGHVICHRCDNPPCINPEHLFSGPQADNVRDMVEKGRMYDRSGRTRGSYKKRQAA